MTTRIQLPALIVTIGLGLVGCATDPASDLTITGIEVSQAVQTPSNTVGLLARRSTTVRVMLDTGSSNAISNVSGLLSVSVDGAQVTPVGGVAAANQPIIVPATPDRDAENDSLYFELPAPTDIPASSNVDFNVVVAGNGQAVEGEALDFTFIETNTPTVYYVPVDYTPSGLGYPDPTLIDAGVGDMFVRGIFPVDDSDPVLYEQLLAPGTVFSLDSDADGRLNGSDRNDLLSGLSSLLGLIALFGGSIDDDFVYGWLAGNPIAGNGLGQVGGQAAFGNTQESRYQRTFAHELAHNFGLNHNSRTLDQPGWDTGARLDSNPNGNNTSGRVKDTSKFDIMVGGRLSSQAWVDTATYNFLLGSPVVASVGAARTPTSVQVLTIQGRFDQAGDRIEKMEPAFRFPFPRKPTPERPDDPYLVEVVDDGGNVYKRSFNALVANDAQSEEIFYGFFEVRIPVESERRLVALRIRDASRPDKVYFASTASKSPAITVTAPEPGASLGAKTTLTWRIEDPDTPLGEMQLQVAYSHDDGKSWVPLIVDVNGTATSIEVNTREVRRSDGQGIIRVFVSDGLVTHFDDVTGLSTPEAIY